MSEAVHVQVTRVSVSLLPEGHPDRPDFEIQVESRDLANDRWAVSRYRRCLSRTGEWDYEPLPSNREDDWLAEHRFPYTEALTLAVKAAPTLSVNGHTVQSVLAKGDSSGDA